jgi:hypothetical protein
MKSLEFGAPELGHLETDVEVQVARITNVDPGPIVRTRLLGLGNDAESLDNLTRDPFLIQNSFQYRDMMHNVPGDIVHLEPKREPSHNVIHS